MRIFSVFFHPLSNFTAVGGAEKRCAEIVEAWNRMGVSVTIVDPDPKSMHTSNAKVDLISMPSPLPSLGKSLWWIYLEWILWTFKACFLCPSLIKRKSYDVILAQNNTLPNLLVAYLLHVVSGLRLCVVVHHLDYAQESNTPINIAQAYRAYRQTRFSTPVAFVKALTLLLIRALLRHADSCIAVSNFTARSLVDSGVPSCKIHVSGNAVNLDVANRLRSTEKCYEGVFLGRVSRDKGVFDLVRIWKQVATGKPKSKLLIIGTGSDFERLRELVKDSNMTSNINPMGNCTDDELYALMMASKVFLFPSTFEGWGLAVGEALACGLPVVCYDIPALREVFGECHSVFFVPIGDTDKFAKTVKAILEKGDLYKLGKIGKEYVKRFSWNSIALRDMQILKTLVQS